RSARPALPPPGGDRRPAARRARHARPPHRLRGPRHPPRGARPGRRRPGDIPRAVRRQAHPALGRPGRPRPPRARRSRRDPGTVPLDRRRCAGLPPPGGDRRPRPGHLGDRHRADRGSRPRRHRRRHARRTPRRAAGEGGHARGRLPLRRARRRRTPPREHAARPAAPARPVRPALHRPRSRRSPRMTRLAHPRTLIVVLVLPLLVVGLGMWALSGRVDRLDAVPAAVVNLDEGAEVEDADGEVETVPFGRLLAGALTQPGTIDGQETPELTGFDCRLTDEEDAEQGLKDGSYSAVVVIPADFSKDLATIGTPEATQAILEVTTNDASGQINALVGTAVADASASTMGGQMAEQYLDGLYLGFNELGDGFSDAADGARDLADGTSELGEGADELSGGTRELADGTTEAAEGARQFSGGVWTFADGTWQAADGTRALADGLG